VEEATGVRAIASPGEAIAGRPIGLYAVTTDDRLAHEIPAQAV